MRTSQAWPRPTVNGRPGAARGLRRLAPQGSDAWNFLAAFTHLGDRYGPYHPGASALSDALEAEGRGSGRRGGRLERLRRDRGARPPEGDKTELEEAMGHVVEAFRFLSARVATLEARLAAQDRPVEGAAWLVPARELGPWAGPVAAHVSATTPGGDIVHADCGEGGLLDALRRPRRDRTRRRAPGGSGPRHPRAGLRRHDRRGLRVPGRTGRRRRSAASC